MESWDGVGGLKMGEFMYDTNPALLRCLVSDSFQIDEIVGRWAGDRIICIGNYATDLPPGVVTENDQWLVEKLLENDSSDEDQDRYDDGPMLGRRVYGKTTQITKKLAYDTLRRPATNICPPNSVWALRNLSKKQFVLSDKAIAGSKLSEMDGSRDAFKDFPGLFQVLIFRTGWSADPSCAAVYNTPKYVPPQGTKFPMNEGAWAGDRLDMVMVTDDGVELNHKGWKDDLVWKADSVDKDADFACTSKSNSMIF